MFKKSTEIPKEHVGRIDATSGIILDGVTKTYSNGFEAVHPTYLKIERGEFFSLLGSSGSGKTTTLKMLSGLEFASTGVITLEGVDITRMPANKRDVHTVFQNYALFPHMSVAKNIAYGLEGRHMEKKAIEKRVTEMIELVDLKGHEQDKPSELSGGMQQRVALARALVLEPKALLLDEPLGALDLKLRHHMQGVLRQIHQAVGITFVYVTHDQEEAFSMSDRIGVMTGGNLVQVSSPKELYTHPNSRFVADFVGASNMLEGTIEAVLDKQQGVYRIFFDVLEQSVTVSGVPYLSVGKRVVGVLRPQFIELILPEYYESADGFLALPVEIRTESFLGGYVKTSLQAKDVELTAHAFRLSTGVSGAGQALATWRASDMWVVEAKDRF